MAFFSSAYCAAWIWVSAFRWTSNRAKARAAAFSNRSDRVIDLPPGDEGHSHRPDGRERHGTKIPRIQRMRYWTSQEHLTGLHHTTTLELGQGSAVCGLEHRAKRDDSHPQDTIGDTDLLARRCSN